MSEEVVIQSHYEPGEKQASFHSSPAFFKILKGALGSGKTRMAIEEVNLLVAEYDGIVGYVMRKTMPALRDSTLHEFLKYMDPNLGRYNKKTEQFNAINDAQVRFRGLDEPSKMRGPEPSFIVMDEADEFTYEDFLTLKGRIRQKRKPGDPGKPYPHFLIMMFNPVAETHWIYQQFVKNKEAYEKAGGLLLLELTTYDNLNNLPEGYIQSTTAGMSPEEVDMFIWGKWGQVIRGKPVYSGSFNPDLHLRKWEYKPQEFTLTRGWDFGYNHPACVWVLHDSLGRKNVDFELLGNKEYLDVFGKRILEITRQRYGETLTIRDHCDPRGFDRSPGSTEDMENSVKVLNSIGIYPTGERGIREYVEPGITVIRKELSTLIEGIPELTVNPECAMIRAAFGGRYVRGDDGKPIKDGYFEHVMDALRYDRYMDRTNSAVKDAILRRTSRNYNRSFNRFTGYGR